MVETEDRPHVKGNGRSELVGGRGGVGGQDIGNDGGE